MKYKIALAQAAACSRKDENLAKAADYTRRACRLGAQIVVFPEYFMFSPAPGAGYPFIRENAESTDGRFVREMRKIAADNSCWIVFGIYESIPEDAQHIYNTSLIVDSSGRTAGVYRKVHLFDAFGNQESKHVKAGDRLFEPIDTPFGRIGLMVCYDSRFPEAARYEAVNGADIIIMPSAWFAGEDKLRQLDILTASRALENTVYLAVSNLCGAIYTGSSRVMGPDGSMIAGAGKAGAVPDDRTGTIPAASEEQLVIAEIDTDALAAIRRKVPALKGRRTDLY